MNPKSQLASALTVLLQNPQDDLDAAAVCLSSCHKVSLQLNDVNSLYWSEEILQGFLFKHKRVHIQEELFTTLLSYFAGGQELDNVESSTALAAFHVGRQNEEEAENWFLMCFHEAKTDYLKYQAALCLGKVLQQCKSHHGALQWFRKAKGYAEKSGCLDSSTIAAYLEAKTLVQLGRIKDSLARIQQDGSKFTSVLCAMVEADIKRHETNELSAYTRARCMLLPLMSNLAEKLMKYLGISCSSLELLLEVLVTDGFSRRFVLNCSRFVHEEAEEALQIERAFFIFELYRSSRMDMIYIEGMLPLRDYLDPRPYLEQGIELLYSEDPYRALEPLVICQQVALVADHSSGVYWSSGLIIRWCEKQVGLRRNELFIELKDCFISKKQDGEDPEAWAAYYIGRACGDMKMLKTALERAKTLSLGYYAALALGDASEIMETKLKYYELMKDYAKEVGKEDLIIHAFLILFGHLQLAQRYESSDTVRRELQELLTGSRLGQAAVRYMQGFGYCYHHSAAATFGESLSILKTLPTFPTVYLYHPYLQSEDDFWTVNNNFDANYLHDNIQKITMKHLGEVQLDSATVDESQLRIQHFMNKVLRIDSLCMEMRLDEAQTETDCMLEELENVNFTHQEIFAGLGLYYKAIIPIQFYSQEDSLDTFNKLMEEATRLATSIPAMSIFHGIQLEQQGQKVDKLYKTLSSTCLTTDNKFGSFSTMRIYNLESLKEYFRYLQLHLFETGDFKRALVWEERERTRDVLYTLKLETEVDRECYLQGLRDFDTDDEKAWQEIECICDMMGKETMVIVSAYITKYLLVYLLHSGGTLVAHKEYLDAPVGFHMETSEESLIRHYELLIQPFDEILEQVKPKHIIFVPNEAMCCFPFAAMQDRSASEQYIIHKYAITTVPSLRLLKQCELQRKKIENRRNISLVVGNPTLDLCQATEEAQYVASALEEAGFRRVISLHPEDATEEAIFGLLPGSHWVHFATHGYESDSRFPHGALRLNKDGVLSGDEIIKQFAFPLDAAAVVLSACRYFTACVRVFSKRSCLLSSGVGEVFAEGVLALSRAFHICRVPSIAVSLWAVPDDSTKLLMEKFYANLVKKMGIAEALQAAMIEMLSEEDEFGLSVHSLASWAPFIITGTPFTTLCN